MRIVRMEYGSAGLRCPALPVYIRIINAVMMISPPMQNMCMGVCTDRSQTCRYVHIFGLSIQGDMCMNGNNRYGGGMTPGLRPGDTCMNSDINTGNDSAGHRARRYLHI